MFRNINDNVHPVYRLIVKDNIYTAHRTHQSQRAPYLPSYRKVPQIQRHNKHPNQPHLII